MERSHEFTINVPGEGTHVIKLLEGVEIEQQDGTMIGRWPAFDLDAESDGEAATAGTARRRARARSLPRRFARPRRPPRRSAGRRACPWPQLDSTRSVPTSEFRAATHRESIPRVVPVNSEGFISCNASAESILCEPLNRRWHSGK